MQLSAWYFGIELTGLGLLLVFGLYTFHTSFGGYLIIVAPQLDD